MSSLNCIQIISGFFQTKSKRVKIVNIENCDTLRAVVDHFSLNDCEVIDVSRFANEDQPVKMEEVINYLSNVRVPTILYGISSMLKLFGKSYLCKEMNSFLSILSKNPIVIIAFQCQEALEELIIRDIRNEERIVFIDEEKSIEHKLCFVSNELSSQIEDSSLISGLNNALPIIEKSRDETVKIVTARRKSNFPDAMYSIIEMNNAFDVLCKRDDITLKLDKDMGSDEQWRKVLDQYSFVNWRLVISSEFGDCENLAKLIYGYANLSDFQKWLLFIGLKLFGVNDNKCLLDSIDSAKKIDDFSRSIYYSITKYDKVDSEFKDYYNERKNLIRAINDYSEATSFCYYIRNKGIIGLWYLTDLSKPEKETVLYLLDKYWNDISKDDLLEVLKIVYLDLYCYLKEYDFDNLLLNNYFSQYKYQKVVNKVFPEFEDIVNYQAENREYNMVLDTRASVVDALDVNNSELYFVDAMGAEYLGYIAEKCNINKLNAKIHVAKCNLPSLTSYNKEFIDELKLKGISKYTDIKELDEIKHNGIRNYNYETTKLPIHLVRELEIIDDLLVQIKEGLQLHDFEKAILISDHGSSRLAVIKEKDILVDVNSKGTHGGRVCEYNDQMLNVPYAIREDDNYVLAGYSRFKGGRKPSVETHGGATIEEVTVPIIEISLPISGIVINVLTLEIYVSYKQLAELRFHSNRYINKPYICINEKKYRAKECANGEYVVDISDIKKMGKYYFDVYDDNNLLKSGNCFEIKSQMMTENDIF